MAVLIDANTEHIAIADDNKWHWTPVTQERALSLWWKSSSIPNSDAEVQWFLKIDDTSGPGVLAGIYNNLGTNVLSVFIFDSEWDVVGYFYHAWSPSTNTWYHIVLNIGADAACDVLVDGSSLGACTYVSWDDDTALDPDQRFISEGVSVDDDFTAAHCAWWGDKLTADEINNIRWNPWWACGHPDLLCYFPLDELTGTNARDFSESSGQTATDGTLTNGPTWADDPPVMMQTGALAVLWAAGAAHYLTPSDSVGIAESVVKGMGLFDAESVALADTPVRASAFLRTPAESFALADVSVKGVGRTDSDALPLADAVEKAIGLVDTELLSIADAMSRVATFARTAAESLALADTSVKGIGLVDAESVSIADSVAFTGAFIRAVADAVTISESLSKGVGRADADSVAITEAVAKVFGVVGADSFVLAESPSKGVGLSKLESLSLADTAALLAAFVRPVVDTLALAETVAKAMGLVAADALGMTEVAVVSVLPALIIIATEILAISDSAAKGVGRVDAELLVLADAAAKGVGRADADLLVLADAAVRAADVSPADGLVVADAVAKAVGLVKADTEAITDSVVVQWFIVLLITSILLRAVCSIEDVSLNSLIDGILLRTTVEDTEIN